MSNSLNTPWRKTAATIYGKPTDGKVFGSVELDVTDLMLYIKQKREAGVKVTLTHIIALATARAIREDIPEMNAFIRRGEVVSHPTIDAVISVLLARGQMGSVRLARADEYTIDDAVTTLRQQIKKAREDQDESQQFKERLSKIPWPIRTWIYKLIYLLNIRWGINMPGLSTHQFGSFVLSNIGSLGLEVGYPALLPVANVAFVLVLGGSREKPWVVDGQVVPRTILNVSVAMDHRLLDGSHGGKLFTHLKKAVKNPEMFEK